MVILEPVSFLFPDMREKLQHYKSSVSHFPLSLQTKPHFFYSNTTDSITTHNIHQDESEIFIPATMVSSFKLGDIIIWHLISSNARFFTDQFYPFSLGCLRMTYCIPVLHVKCVVTTLCTLTIMAILLI